MQMPISLNVLRQITLLQAAKAKRLAIGLSPDENGVLI